MNHVQLVWCAIIAAQLAVNIPFALSLFQRKTPMAVDPRVQASLAEIAASLAALAAKPNQDAVVAQMTQDATDTAAAVQVSADAVKAAVGG